MATGEEDFLQREVNESQTQEANKEELQKMLQKASLIKNTLGKIKPDVNESYENLRFATIGSLRNLRIETDTHLKEVQKSLTGDIDFSSLSEWDITNSELDYIRIRYTEMIRMSLDLNQRDALLALQSSNEGYQESWTPAAITHSSQESYITTILWQDHPGYNNEFIQGFNDETVWNFLVPLPKFENILQTTPPEEWNSMALIHYFEKLHSQWNFNLKTLIEKMWAPQIVALKKLWDTKPNGYAMKYFQNNPELKWIVEKDIDYSTLLTSPDRFKDIAKVFDALPEDEKETVKAQLFEYLTGLGSIERMDMLTGGSNLGGIEEWVYKDVILKARAYYTGEAFAAQLRDIYAGGPDIGDVLTAIIQVSAAGTGGSFDFSGVNSIIEEYNSEHGSNFPLIAGNFWRLVEDTAKNLYDNANLVENFQENLDKIQKVRAEILDLEKRITELENQISTTQREITSLIREGDTELAETQKQALSLLQDEKTSLKTRMYYLSRNLWDAEKVAQDSAETKTQLEAYKSSFEAYRGFNFQLDMNNPTDIRHILANPKERIGKLSNAQDILKVLQLIPKNTEVKPTNSEVFFDDIPVNFRKEEKIVLFFLERNFRESNISQLPSEMIKNPDIFSRIIQNNPLYTRGLLRTIERIFSDKKEAYEFLVHMKENNPDIFTVQVQDIVSKYLPYSIKSLDAEQILSTPVSSEISINTLEKAQEAIFLLSQEGNVNEKAATREALEIYFDSNDLSQYKELLSQLADTKLLHDFPDALKKLTRSDRWIVTELIKKDPDIIVSLPEEVIQHPLIMQEVGKIWLVNINHVSPYIDTPKTLANFLIGYFSMNYSPQALVNNHIIQDRKQQIWLDEIDYIGLTEKEKEALNTFKSLHDSAKIELEWYKQDWEKMKEQFDENMLKEIDALLVSLDGKISMEDREIIIEKFKAWENDAWLNMIAEILRDGKYIAEVNEKILEIIEKKHRKLDETTGPQLDGITSIERGQVEKAWLYDRENNSFDMLALEGRFEAYINTKAQNISDINKLKDPVFLLIFLKSLNIPEKILEQHQEEIIERLQNKIDLKIVEIAKKKHSETADEDMWKLYSPAGWVFKSAEQEMVQNIQNGNFSLSWNTQNATQTSGQTSSSQTQGTYGNTSYTLQYNPGETAVLQIWGKQIDISQDEAKAMQNNPEAIENFIDADTYFSQAWLESVWRNYRNEIVYAMNMTSTTWDVTLDLTDDSLSKNELMRFAKFAYKIIYGKDATPSNNPADLQSQFRKYGNIYGEDASRFGDQFVSDVTLKGIDRNKSSLSIASTFKSLAEWEWLQKTSS